jgi:hypothetical protein
MSWFYKGEVVNAVLPEHIGFVYEIKCPDGRKYIGRKLCISTKKKVIKGRNRRVVCETPWQKYCGSSEILLQLVKIHGLDAFNREILFWCKTKSEMAYIEAREMFAREVLLKDEYLNAWITLRINGKNLKSLKNPLTDSINEFINQQEPLGTEFQKVLNDNRWDLYESSVKGIIDD